jgi:hypothetical protein
MLRRSFFRLLCYSHERSPLFTCIYLFGFGWTRHVAIDISCRYIDGMCLLIDSMEEESSLSDLPPVSSVFELSRVMVVKLYISTFVWLIYGTYPCTLRNTSSEVRSFMFTGIIGNQTLCSTLSLPRNLTACPYFCSFVISWSPCLTTSVYCLFLSSGRFVSIMLLTRSMVQGIRSAAINFARSL